MELQWWIDTAGKLGPACIALLVLSTTRSQNRALNAVSLRAAEVEDQKLRLAVLDRRVQAVDAVREAIGHFHQTGELTSEVRGKLIDTLRLAEVVFDTEYKVAIEECLRKAVVLRFSAMRLRTTKDETERSDLAGKTSAAEQAFLDDATAIVQWLVEGTRVTSVPPLVWPQKSRTKSVLSWASKRLNTVRSRYRAINARRRAVKANRSDLNDE